MKRHKLLAAVLASAALSLPIAASATCEQQGLIVWMYSRGSGGTDGGVYLRNGPLSDHYYTYFFDSAADPSLAALGAAAMTSKVRVRIIGDAVSCPGTGGQRNGGNISGSNFIVLD